MREQDNNLTSGSADQNSNAPREEQPKHPRSEWNALVEKLSESMDRSRYNAAESALPNEAPPKPVSDSKR